MDKKPGTFYQDLLAEECFKRTESIRLADGNSYVLDAHQQDGMLETACALEEGKKSFAIVHPGGSGKTVLEAGIVQASQAAKKLLGRHDDLIDLGDDVQSKDVVIAVERSLMSGIRDHLELALGTEVGVWGGGHKDLEPNVIVTSIQSLQRNKGSLTENLHPEQVSLIIGDEADKYLTKGRKAVLGKFRNAIKIGLTATPEWSDGRHIDEAWGEVIHHLSLREGITRGINVPPLFYMYEADIDGDSIAISGDDYDKTSLASAMKSVEIETAIPEIYKQMVPSNKRKNFPTLVYVPSVATLHATEERLKQEFAGTGLNITAWSGDISTDRLNGEIDGFQRGAIDVLVLCEMGGRGLDLPRARCIIDGYPTLSANKLEQRHSRALRRIRKGTVAERDGFEKDFALIAQVLPKSNSFKPLTLLDVLDCWPDYRPGRVLGFGSRPVQTGGGQPPEQSEVEEIAENIRQNPVKSRLTLLENVDILEALKEKMSFADIPQADDDGFIYLPKE